MYMTEKHELFRKLVKNFAETELTPEILDEVEATNHFPRELIAKYAKCGFTGVKIPKKYGGSGWDTRAYVIMNEEIACVSAVSAIYANTPNSLGGGPLLAAGTDEQLEKYLPPLARGEKIISFSLTEPGAGSDAGQVQTTAEKDGDYYILNGRKCFATHGPECDYAIIFAKTDPTKKGSKGISTFILDMTLEGVSRGLPEKKMGLIGAPTGDIIMKNVRVHKSDLLGEENKGFSNAMKTLVGGRIGTAGHCIGVARAALEESIKYSKEREQFGRPIKDFQAISFMIAEMATKLEASRLLTYKAAYLLDTGKDASSAAAMAKFYASEACNEICAKAIQIHGGYGFIKDYKVERLYRDCRVFTIFEGTSQVQQMVISGSLLR
jgi:alkylation response protein AidB-like acyl-CoA dehydrogenase